MWISLLHNISICIKKNKPNMFPFQWVNILPIYISVCSVEYAHSYCTDTFKIKWYKARERVNTGFFNTSLNMYVNDIHLMKRYLFYQWLLRYLNFHGFLVVKTIFRDFHIRFNWMVHIPSIFCCWEERDEEFRYLSTYLGT